MAVDVIGQHTAGRDAGKYVLVVSGRLDYIEHIIKYFIGHVDLFSDLFLDSNDLILRQHRLDRIELFPLAAELEDFFFRLPWTHSPR